MLPGPLGNMIRCSDGSEDRNDCSNRTGKIGLGLITT